MAVIDKVGRKPMLIWGSVVMWIAMVIPGIIVALQGHDWKTHVAGGWTAVVFIWIYVGGFGATWGPVSWTLSNLLSMKACKSSSANGVTNKFYSLGDFPPIDPRQGRLHWCLEQLAK